MHKYEYSKVTKNNKILHVQQQPKNLFFKVWIKTIDFLRRTKENAVQKHLVKFETLLKKGGIHILNIPHVHLALKWKK